jgi:putative endonuclease
MRMPAFLRARTAQQITGQIGEDQALTYLRQQGLHLLERNFRCKGGEIDLIMQDGKVLVFVEVRMRSDNKFGGAAASVGSAKQKRLIIAAQVYLQRHSMPPPCRFDVIAFDDKEMTWLQNAIEA